MALVFQSPWDICADETNELAEESEPTAREAIHRKYHSVWMLHYKKYWEPVFESLRDSGFVLYEDFESYILQGRVFSQVYMTDMIKCREKAVKNVYARNCVDSFLISELAKLEFLELIIPVGGLAWNIFARMLDLGAQPPITMAHGLVFRGLLQGRRMTLTPAVHVRQAGQMLRGSWVEYLVHALKTVNAVNN